MRSYFLGPATCLLLMLGYAGAGLAAEYNGEFRRAASQTTDQIIVRWKSASAFQGAQKAARSAGIDLRSVQRIDASTEVLRLPRPMHGTELQELIRRLESADEVSFAAADLRRRPHALTNDPLLISQWYLLSDQPAATRTHLAWDTTTARPQIVIAVLDTGVRFDHPDLGTTTAGGKVLPGYDFISRPPIANDGDGRDADASDPGDWVDADDLALPDFAECDAADSSWHGTRVAGLIGAGTDNLEGLAGAAFAARILPVRVMGKCGGFDSDIIAGLRWAAGLPVSGVPANPTPATVINMSLGGDGTCTAAYQSAVDEVLARGVVIVASAGNDGSVVSTPASCSGVIGVAGIRHIGTKVGFSNLGREVSIAAPGGNCVNIGAGQPCLFPITVATNTGLTAPGASSYTDQIRYNVGTSFSAPQVAAAAALMRSVNAQLLPAQLSARMQTSATAFPTNPDPVVPTCRVPASSTDFQTTECNCTAQTCGAGMLNAAAAVEDALRPAASIRTQGTLAIGTTLTVDGTGSFAADGRSVTNFQWAVESTAGNPPALTGASQSVATLRPDRAGEFTVRLTVSDAQGAQDTATVTLVTPAPAPAGPSPTSSGGGGGELGGVLAMGLCGFVAWRRYRSRSPFCGKRPALANRQA